MNTAAPHELIPEAILRQLPPDLRRRFAPIPERDVERVAAMNEAERAVYLKEHPTDGLRLARAQEKRARRKLARELGLKPTQPALEGLDLAAPLHAKEH